MPTPQTIRLKTESRQPRSIFSKHFCLQVRRTSLIFAKIISKPCLLKKKKQNDGTILVDLVNGLKKDIFSKYYLGLHYPGAPNSSVAASLENPGRINWEMALCLVIVYIICYFSLWKGIKMSGKVWKEIKMSGKDGFTEFPFLCYSFFGAQF